MSRGGFIVQSEGPDGGAMYLRGGTPYENTWQVGECWARVFTRRSQAQAWADEYDRVSREEMRPGYATQSVVVPRAQARRKVAR